MSRVDISVVVVEYKNMDLAFEAIRSFHHLNKINVIPETVVVSNSCYQKETRDRITALLPEVKFIYNRKNYGFAKGVNQGIVQSQGELILLLNPDARIVDASISKAIKFLKSHTKVGIVGPKILDEKGEVQDSCRRFITPTTLISRTVRRFLMGKKGKPMRELNNLDVAQAVDWVSGACMLVKREAIDAVGLLDERYFMYVEDMDWCRRFWEKGWQVWYFPYWTVVHAARRASTGSASPLNKLTWIHILSMLKYFVKWRLR